MKEETMNSAQIILDEDKLLDLMEKLLKEAAEEGLGIVADFQIIDNLTD